MSNQGLQTLASSEANYWNFSRISEGMSQAQVMRIMRKPYDYKTIEICGEVCLDIYDIWFYVTRPTVLGQSRLVHQNLTPVVFKNGVLIGWGYHIYDKVAQAQKSSLSEEEQTLKNKEIEDRNLEKALEAPPGPAPQPPAQKPPANALQPTKPKTPNPAKQPNKNPAKPLSMSQPSQGEENTPPPKPKAEVPEKKEPLLNEEDERALQQESEQDFDFW
jgi:hypothetical protein